MTVLAWFTTDVSGISKAVTVALGAVLAGLAAVLGTLVVRRYPTG